MLVPFDAFACVPSTLPSPHFFFFLEFCDLIFLIATNDVRAIQSVCWTSMTNFKTLKAATSPFP
jgi:hypothetical protein